MKETIKVSGSMIDILMVLTIAKAIAFRHEVIPKQTEIEEVMKGDYLAAMGVEKDQVIEALETYYGLNVDGVNEAIKPFREKHL
jgi:hypothetical protein